MYVYVIETIFALYLNNNSRVGFKFACTLSLFESVRNHGSTASN